MRQLLSVERCVIVIRLALVDFIASKRNSAIKLEFLFTLRDSVEGPVFSHSAIGYVLACSKVISGNVGEEDPVKKFILTVVSGPALTMGANSLANQSQAASLRNGMQGTLPVSNVGRGFARWAAPERPAVKPSVRFGAKTYPEAAHQQTYWRLTPVGRRPPAGVWHPEMRTPTAVAASSPAPIRTNSNLVFDCSCGAFTAAQRIAIGFNPRHISIANLSVWFGSRSLKNQMLWRHARSTGAAGKSCQGTDPENSSRGS